MVTQVTPEIRASIDWYLDGLARKWGEALDTMRDWESLDPLDQDVFDVEWPLTLDYLDRLREYRRQSLFSPRQERRFQELKKSLYDHESELEVILGPGGAMLDPVSD